MTDIQFNAAVEHLAIARDLDWTAGQVTAMLVDKLTWTPAPADGFVATALAAGAVETSGTRTVLTTPTAVPGGASNCVFWSADPIVYPGVLLGEAFDTLVLFQQVTNDLDSYLLCSFDLGAQTGDGANVTLNPDTNGFMKW